MPGESPKELVLRMHEELLRTRDPERVEDFFAADFVSHNTPPGLPEGVEGVKRFFGMLRDGLSGLDVTIAVDLVRVDGKIVEHRGLTDTVGLLRQLAG
jgi:predicted SnoaL-like aldol condensation-catalyzing enzyme